LKHAKKNPESPVMIEFVFFSTTDNSSILGSFEGGGMGASSVVVSDEEPFIGICG